MLHNQYEITLLLIAKERKRTNNNLSSIAHKIFASNAITHSPLPWNKGPAISTITTAAATTVTAAARIPIARAPEPANTTGAAIWNSRSTNSVIIQLPSQLRTSQVLKHSPMSRIKRKQIGTARRRSPKPNYLNRFEGPLSFLTKMQQGSARKHQKTA